MNPTSKRVLVVDDEDVVCQSYERVLSNAGFEVAKAHSGAEALEQVSRSDFDVVLADLKMPGMDGLEMVSRVREIYPQMPVVVITGFPSADTLNEAARLGVNDYLTKPVAPDVLMHATTQALTAPPRSASAPFDAGLFAAARPIAVAIPMPIREPLMWPERPVIEPVPRPVAASAPAVDAVAEPTEPGFVGTALRLVAAPFVSLAYVIFLPFLGFALFFVLGAKALAHKFAPREV